MDPISAATLAGMLCLALGLFLGHMACRERLRHASLDLQEAGEYGFRLLDDPLFYQSERQAHEETCMPAHFGSYGRILEDSR